jgi:hypothetical protein
METAILPIASICQFVRRVEEPSEPKYLIVLPFPFVVTSVGVENFASTLFHSLKNLSKILGPILDVPDFLDLCNLFIVLTER